MILSQIHENLVIGEQKIIEMFPEKVNNWVPVEAKELKYTPGYGTFGEALVRCVEEKVSPILAELIMQIDLNNNLMILRTAPSYSELWMTLFKSVGFTNNESLGIHDTGVTYSATFPFSHNLILMIEESLDKQSIGQGTYFDVGFILLALHYISRTHCNSAKKFPRLIYTSIVMMSVLCR